MAGTKLSFSGPGQDHFLLYPSCPESEREGEKGGGGESVADNVSVCVGKCEGNGNGLFFRCPGYDRAKFN